MRLGQLSRKLNIKSDQIVDFIENEFNESIKNHPNCKVKDEYLTSIESYFLVESVIDTEESDKETEDPVSTTEPVAKDPETENIITEKSEEASPKINDQPSESIEEEVDNEEEVRELIIEEGVIKAPKPEVEGIKVVGKIDLPEPKANPEEVNDGTEDKEGSEETEKVSLNERVQKHSKSGKKERKKRPKLSLEEKKLKEEQRYKKQQEAKKKREKELKKKNYEQMMQEKASQSKSAPKKKKSSKKKSQENTGKDKPKTVWGKFMRWLNT